MIQVSLTKFACALALVLGQPGAATTNGGPIAHVLCSPGEDMRERLESRYRATRAWAGLRGPDEVVELWQDATGDWTLIIRHAGGNWCIVAMGDVFEPFADIPQS